MDGIAALAEGFSTAITPINLLYALLGVVLGTAIYCGGMYSGSTTSILLNTPGESASVVTAIGGNLMATRGRAGMIGTLALALPAPVIVKLAIQMGHPATSR